MYKKILSIDTSFHQTSIAILNNSIIDQNIKSCYYNHEKNILTMIHEISIRNKINIKDFEIISFSNGPGNFTSLRVGIGIAQGLSLPHNIPLLGFSTFKVLAEQAWRMQKARRVIICIVINKKKYFWAQYIRNTMNIWIGHHTESILDIHSIYTKINSIKNKWNIIGLYNNQYQKFKNKLLNFIDIQLPYAQDLITLTLTQIKNIKINNININYIINPTYCIKNKK